MKPAFFPSLPVLVVACVLLLPVNLPAQVSTVNAFPHLAFDFVTDIQAPPDGSDRLFVIEQVGMIRVFENDSTTASSQVVLDHREAVGSGGEMGMLGMAFHPAFPDSNYLYVNYTANDPMRTVVSRFELDRDTHSRADPASERVLLEVPQPDDNHNGGQLQFGPDGYLYIGMGEGGAPGDPFKDGVPPMTLLSGMLRIDVDGRAGSLPPDCAAAPEAYYWIPPDNPLVDGPGNQCDELYAYGLRNPWRFAFDAQDRLWAADVGELSREEINLVEPGQHYGWNRIEGTKCMKRYSPNRLVRFWYRMMYRLFPDRCDRDDFAPPIWEYAHDKPHGLASITGGYVYRGTACPALTGQYIYGDYVFGDIWGLRYEGEGSVENTLLIEASGLLISTFGEDQDGELYIAHYTSGGTLHRFSCQ